MNHKRLQTQDVVVQYTKLHLTMAEIGALHGVTRQAVYKVLKVAGIPPHLGEHVQVNCDMCGESFDKYRGKWRKSKEHFCSRECQMLSLENPDYKEWRQGSRLARRIVALHFPLEPQHIVHHRDEDQRNNDRANLMVFANQSDHLKYHHGKSHVVPLWDGAVSSGYI